MRILVRSILALGLALAATPASAQVIHSLQFGVGIVLPRGFDGRESGDVLVENLTGFEIEPGLTSALAFPDVENCFDRFNVTSRPSNCINGFRTGKIFGEWNVAFGDRLEVGVGLGYHRKTVLSLYRDLYNENGTDIEQDIRLRVIPLTGVVRFMPFGRAGDFQPYVGAGLGILNWRYSEVGEFVDFSDESIFTARYNASGNSAGPVIFGGVRAPVADVWLIGGEIRYQKAEGTIDNAEDFLSDRIDLGGWTTSFTIGLRF